MTAKLVREIMVAAKLGGPDPDLNARLAAAVEKARKASFTCFSCLRVNDAEFLRPKNHTRTPPGPPTGGSGDYPTLFRHDNAREAVASR